MDLENQECLQMYKIDNALRKTVSLNRQYENAKAIASWLREHFKKDSHSGQSVNPESSLSHEMEGNGKRDRVEPLDATLRDQFERVFGADFSSVKIHTGSEADASAKRNNALAFTVGSQISFAAGEYNPQMEHGIKLLAHELVHVIQGLRGDNMAYAEDRIGLEQEAEKVEALLEEKPLHTMDPLELRPNGTQEGTAYHGSAEMLFKSAGGSGSDSLDDFLETPSEPVYVLHMKSGQTLRMTKVEYDDFLDGIISRVIDWLKDETTYTDGESKIRIVTQFENWLKGGVA